MERFPGGGVPLLGGFSLPSRAFPRSLPLTPEASPHQGQFGFKDLVSLSLRPSHLPTTVFSFSLPLPSFFIFFNMQVAMKFLLMKYLLRSLLWARLITYLCLSLASHILNTHLLFSLLIGLAGKEALSSVTKVKLNTKGRGWDGGHELMGSGGKRDFKFPEGTAPPTSPTSL